MPAACGCDPRSSAQPTVLTMIGHRCTLMDMERVSASKFKAKLGKYMRAVRMGREITVTDRDQPVARLVPIREDRGASKRVSISTHRAVDAPPLGEVDVAAIKYRGPSTTDLLLED